MCVFWGCVRCNLLHYKSSQIIKMKRPAYLAVKLNLNIPKTANQTLKENNQHEKKNPPSKRSSIRVPKSWECYSVIVPNSHGLSYQPLPMRPHLNAKRTQLSIYWDHWHPTILLALLDVANCFLPTAGKKQIFKDWKRPGER